MCVASGDSYSSCNALYRWYFRAHISQVAYLYNVNALRSATLGIDQNGVLKLKLRRMPI